MKIIIVGASFAGMSAALECHQIYPEAQIVLMDKEKEVGFFPNVFNWQLKGELKQIEEARSELWGQVQQTRIDVRLETRFVRLDADNQVLIVEQGEQVLEEAYDVLILAMGAKQVWEVEDKALHERILSSKYFLDAQKSWEKIRAAQSVIIIGGGQIGLESADALSQLPLSLTLFEAETTPLAKYVDADLMAGIEEELKKRQIDVHTAEIVENISLSPSGNKVQVDTLKGSYEADYLLLATNFQPNTDIVGGILECNPDKTIIVDDYLETSQPNIFAIGDLIQLPFAFFGKAYLPLINHAILTGRLVAYNLLKKRRPLQEVQRIVSSHLFGYNITSVGLTERQAQLWTDVDTVVLQAPFSQWEIDELTFKLIVQKSDGRLLGGQLISTSRYIHQMNILSLAISNGMTAQDMVEQSWLCLPRYTNLVPIVAEACQLYLHRQEEESAHED
ncbi:MULTISPECIES: FAD-dependent oxidoreductase [unclassified Streptococcus]|uniref:FAD-dependent oxidoreductase n=1 Tax=unclassified Streptococcus TaxID=2608887 RepID=UPI001072B59E|nr:MULTISPECIES: FAD-dependent oxidoreductase [unclassified Streptococcus]MBF0786401.1 FAD-dependent oxidoreductase [Streptococcus sp. 19428wC2_LYSM12]MCQ9212508.1 FAD-dependent oxidoreductase [Streptococcus sp. B01]MCQ9213847.1 FAD-dependent oxidoreductase [Streptococcus sp. O1]TFV06809.1 NAD(P)/FAD-dependent oxidoreductase [Streptococcus sp. LYSM12]